MLHIRRPRIAGLALLGLFAMFGVTPAPAQPKKPKYATKADIERLEKKIDEQRAIVMKLIALQQQYLQQLIAVAGGDLGVNVAMTDPAKSTGPKSIEPVPAVAIQPKTERKRVEPRPARPAIPGTVVGKVKGGGDAVVYLDIAAPSVRATASMKQENKQFSPRVLVVQRGTRVEFPNMDAVFHNVFSVTPDNSFDLGSYRKGESKSVTLTKPGVVTVYCNMHPQMVGHVLVVPGPIHVRTGKDGFFKLANVPPGRHKVVVWAPNAKAVTSEVTVGEGEVSTVELQLGARSGGPHLNKDGMPYGSYRD